MSWQGMGGRACSALVVLGSVFPLLRFSLRAEEGGWKYLTDGKSMPTATTPWEGAGTSATITGEGLRLSDPSTADGSGRTYSIAWGVLPTDSSVAEARLKTISCSAECGNYLGLSDGYHELTLTFYPDRIELYQSKKVIPFNTADGFHVYRVELKSPDFRLFADGRLLLDGKGLVSGAEKANQMRGMLAFGCGSSGATGEGIWQFVRYQEIQRSREGLSFQTPRLKVTVGRTVSIVPPAENPPSSFPFFQYKDGRIAVRGYWSRDNGETWEKGADGPPVGAVELPDGTVLTPGYGAYYSGKRGEYNTTVSLSLPDGNTVTEDAKAFIPDGAEETLRDEGVGGTVPTTGWFDHGTVLLADGNLLSVMYGNFRDDKVQIPIYKFTAYYTRSWAMRSSDRGKSWSYLSTIAYDPSIGQEGFDEPSLLNLPNGDLLCFLRTGGSRLPSTPLFLCRSRNQGKTWSKPEAIADRGVWPNACRNRNGVIAVTYGRPFQWLAFSADDGRTWEGHYCFYSPTKWIQWYNYVATAGKDRFLAVYQRDGETDPKTGAVIKEIVGTFFTVKRR